MTNHIKEGSIVVRRWIDDGILMEEEYIYLGDGIFASLRPDKELQREKEEQKEEEHKEEPPTPIK